MRSSARPTSAGSGASPTTWPGSSTPSERHSPVGHSPVGWVERSKTHRLRQSAGCAALHPPYKTIVGLFRRAGLQLGVIFLADAIDQPKLRFDEVDLLFLTLEDVGKQVARDIVADLLAMVDRLAQPR